MKRQKLLISFLIGLLCVFIAYGLPSYSRQGKTIEQPRPLKLTSSLAVIPLEEQPFYPELVKRADLWLSTPLAQVIGDTPRDTLLNFYAVMADVGILIDEVTHAHLDDPGLFWNQQTMAEIKESEDLFDAAVASLDGASFQLGVRKYLKDEAAIQLKHGLDFIFNTSRQLIAIPDASAMKSINEERSKPTQTWTLPGSAIELSSLIKNNPENSNFYFSAETVGNASKIYSQVYSQLDTLPSNHFITDTFYQDFIHTPGHLFPPKWYLMLPSKFRSIIETEVFFSETLFQVALSIVAISLFALITFLIIRILLKTYKLIPNQLPQAWNQDSIAWKRAILILPLVPLAKLIELFIDEYLNFTGTPLIIITIVFEVIYFSLFIVFVYLFFEAFGRSLSDSLVRMSGKEESWRLLRTTNRVIPLCRVASGLFAIILTYRMLLQLGLSPTVVLALSTVPGLAIGLGASKLLSNLFAGLSLQTDRPMRVGEFCEIGENQGFITKIGLRSVEIETATGIITIPNAVAEDCIVKNHSRNKNELNTNVLQGLELKLDIETNTKFSPDQIDDLLTLARNYIKSRADIIRPYLSIDLQPGGQQSLVCIGMIKVSNWYEFIHLKESLNLALNQLIARVDQSHFILPVSYDTTNEQLSEIPAILQRIINTIPGFELVACRLMTIAEFSYDFKCHLRSKGLSYREFKDSVNTINRELLAALAAAHIVIPFPTAIEIQKDET